jgi:hypothetical protein
MQRGLGVGSFMGHTVDISVLVLPVMLHGAVCNAVPAGMDVPHRFSLGPLGRTGSLGSVALSRRV